MIGRDAFSERRFSGYASWLLSFWTFAVIAGILSSWSNIGANVRLVDFTLVLIIQPLWMLLLSVIPVALLSFRLEATLPAVLQATSPHLPILLLPALIDACLNRLGILSVPAFSNAPNAILSIFTAGFFPHPIASIGTLAGLLAVAFLVYCIVIACGESHVRSVVTAVATSVGLTVLLLVPSLLGWIGLQRDTSVASASSSLIQRGLVVQSMDGFWWHNLYERFAITNGGEAEVSVRSWLGALAFLALSFLIYLSIVRSLRWSWRAWLAYARPSQFLLTFSLVTFGIFLALSQHARLTFRLVDVTSWLVFLVVCKSAWLWTVGRRDIAEVAHDEQFEPDRPLITGALRQSQLEEMNVIFLVLTLVGAWLLGWPVFASIVVFLLLSDVSRFTLPRPRQPRLRRLVLRLSTRDGQPLSVRTSPRPDPFLPGA